MIGTLNVTDPDAGGTAGLTWALAGDGASDFEVTSAGWLASAAALDYEAAPSYTLNATATDTGGLSVTVRVAVAVTDLNDLTITSITASDGGSDGFASVGHAEQSRSRRRELRVDPGAVAAARGGVTALPRTPATRTARTGCGTTRPGAR